MNDPDTIVWRGMTRAQLDTAYDNTNAVPDAAQRRDAWIARSAQMRAEHPELLDLAYGPKPRNTIDVFRCGRERAPLFAFIHGGYWQRNAKDMFACMADGPLARGFDVALIGYTLAPDVTLTEIVAETHAAIRWLRREGPRRGVADGQARVVRLVRRRPPDRHGASSRRGRRRARDQRHLRCRAVPAQLPEREASPDRGGSRGDEPDSASGATQDAADRRIRHGGAAGIAAAVEGVPPGQAGRRIAEPAPAARSAQSFFHHGRIDRRPRGGSAVR